MAFVSNWYKKRSGDTVTVDGQRPIPFIMFIVVAFSNSGETIDHRLGDVSSSAAVDRSNADLYKQGKLF